MRPGHPGRLWGTLPAGELALHRLLRSQRGVEDFGGRLMTALASVIDATDPDEIDRIISEGIPDPIGTFYRFSLAHSLLRRAALVPDDERHELPLPKPVAKA